MKVFFLSIAYLSFLLSIGILIYTKPYVSYCQKHANNNNYTTNLEHNSKFERNNLVTHAICASFYRDFSKNELLFLTVGTVYSIIHKVSSKFFDQAQKDLPSNNIPFKAFSNRLFLELKIILLCYFYVFCFLLYIFVYKGLFYLISVFSRLVIILLNISFYVMSVETISLILFNFSFKFILGYIPHKYLYDCYEFISYYVFDFVFLCVSNIQDEWVNI